MKERRERRGKVGGGRACEGGRKKLSKKRPINWCIDDGRCCWYVRILAEQPEAMPMRSCVFQNVLKSKPSLFWEEKNVRVKNIMRNNLLPVAVQMGAPVHHRHPHQCLPVTFHSHVRRNKAQEVNMKVESEWRKKVFARNYSASSKVKYTAANSLFHFWYHWSEVKSFKRWRSCRYPPWDFKAGCGRED